MKEHREMHKTLHKIVWLTGKWTRDSRPATNRFPNKNHNYHTTMKGKN